ncbi:MAG: PepSY domain-containing protein [Solirubrobacterales bacterium]
MAVVAAVLLLAFFVARSCQESQVRITKEQAIATAEREVEFTPENTQIRFLRQGLDSKPFWIVSLSIPKGAGADRFSRLALIHVDANTGEVTKVEEQEPRRSGQTGKR